ncbi:MAG: hypothetical protein LC745_04460 [Planctomycetia bacterium]|nr:hypothetical protein [Planctomycetia bacterium]
MKTMGGSNPYEAPGVGPGPGIDLRKRELALRFLDLRQRGYSLSLFYRRAAKRYLLRFAYFIPSLLFLASQGLWALFYVMLGLLTGVTAQELGWELAVGKIWPFQDEVTDWEKVRRIADGIPTTPA